MSDKEHIKSIDLDGLPRGYLYHFWLDLITNSFGEIISVPLLIGRGKREGPVLGITAAIHGNELNGIPVIQRLFKELEKETISGTVIGVPVVNVLSFQRKERRFVDGVDLNHIMPGKKNGNVSEVYAYRLFSRIIKRLDYLVDLHTASRGRVNSFYIRADMKEDITAHLAKLQNADIIVHNPPSDGTLRGAAENMGIPAITVELGNPSTFQKNLIDSGITGLKNVLTYLGMVEGDIAKPENKAVVCSSSKWIYTDRGGLLTVHPRLGDIVEAGQLIATQFDIFGDRIKKYLAPEKGIVIGKSVSPVNQTGGRILHLGKIEK